MKNFFKVVAFCSTALVFSSLAYAQEIPARVGTVAAEKSGALAAPKAAVDSVDIAKKLANPIANMISVPLQYEFSRGLGRNQGGSEQTLLFQPVMPFNLGGGDTFIVRPIVAGAREVSIQGANGQPYSGYGIASVTVNLFMPPIQILPGFGVSVLMQCRHLAIVDTLALSKQVLVLLRWF